MSYYAAIERSSVLRIFSLVLLSTATFVFLIITLSIIFAKIPDFPNLQTLVKTKLDQYFENINQIYTKKGFWWRIVPDLLYIEMVIEDRMPKSKQRLYSKDDSDEVNYAEDDKNTDEKKKDVTNVTKLKIGNLAPNTEQSSSRSKKSSNKVMPLNIKDGHGGSYNPVGHLGPATPDEFKGNITMQTQPMKIRGRLNNELSRDESISSKPIIGDNYRTLKTEDLKNKQGERSKSYNHGYSHSQVDKYTPEDAPHQMSERNREFIGKTNQSRQYESPEQRLNKNPDVYEGQHQRYQKELSKYEEHEPEEQDDEEPQRENSMKMEDLLSNYEADNIKQRTKKSPTELYPSTKNKAGFGEENSHFGTDWMGD